MIQIKPIDISGAFTNLEQLSDNRLIARFVNRDITPFVEAAIERTVKQVPPPRDNSKFVWSFNRAANNRARRWWFAAIKRGEVNTDGSHYVRSGEIPNAWKTAIDINANEVILIMFNSADGADRVYGSNTITQVPGHAATGWISIIRLAEEIEAGTFRLEVGWVELIRSLFR